MAPIERTVATMREREGFPAGVPCWIDTAQADPEAATHFYGPLFGWEFEDRMPADGPGNYFVARLHGKDVAAVGSGQGPVAWNTYVMVDSADEAAAKVTQAGGAVIAHAFDVLDAGRMAVCADQAGAAFNLWQAGIHKGAELVNAPGTWNWSDLRTADVEGSTAFYGAVFGWEASPVSFGDIESIMWRKPGYADFLEQFDPGLRERHTDFGAPEGFSDAVGWLITTDATPHWHVTFSVSDTDAVAAKATELGGAIVVEPNDIGPVRVATIRDPQGAVFTVSQFNVG